MEIKPSSRWKYVTDEPRRRIELWSYSITSQCAASAPSVRQTYHPPWLSWKIWGVPRAGRACPSELTEWRMEKVGVLGRLPPTKQKGAKTMLLRPSSKLPSLVRVRGVHSWNSLIMQTGSLGNGEPPCYYLHLQRNLQVMQCYEIPNLFCSQIV